VQLRLGAAFAGQQMEIDRAVLFPGFADATRAKYDGYTAQAFGELGYRIAFPSAVVEPFLGGAAMGVHRDRFAEAGGPAALLGFGEDHELGTSTLGVRAEARLGHLPLTVRGMAGWRHASAR
jgi:outer membrane autotransporter protein